MFRFKQVPKVLIPTFASAGEKLIELCQQNQIKKWKFFVDQATPRFELGKKDLQSPALPLGHAAQIIPYEIDENILSFFGSNVGLLNFFFYCTWIFHFESHFI